MIIPHRTQIYQFELSELILLLKLDKQFPFEQSEATVSQSTGGMVRLEALIELKFMNSSCSSSSKLDVA